jgi:hypothetical protein
MGELTEALSDELSAMLETQHYSEACMLKAPLVPLKRNHKT